MTPFHYVLIRYTPRLAAAEFANIGVLLVAPEERRVCFKLSERHGRLSRFFNDFDAAVWRAQIADLRSRLLDLASSEGRTIADAVAEVLPENGNSFQASAPMGGICKDVDEKLSALFEEFVGTHRESRSRQRVDDRALLHSVESRLRQAGVLPDVQRNEEIKGREYSYTFKFAWRNGQRQVLEPISLDYANPSDIVEKANTWGGRLLTLQRAAPFEMTSVVAPPSSATLSDSYERAVTILRAAPNMRAVLTEEELDAYVAQIRDDLRHSN